MAQFKFLLATLLKIRQADRDARQAELAAALAADRGHEDRQNEIDRHLQHLRRDYSQSISPGPVATAQLTIAENYHASLRARRAGEAEKRLLLAEKIESRRAALVEADRQVRALEKLREKQAQRLERQQARREAKSQDEVALRLHREHHG